jgi:hypothetical protein
MKTKDLKTASKELLDTLRTWAMSTADTRDELWEHLCRDAMILQKSLDNATEWFNLCTLEAHENIRKAAIDEKCKNLEARAEEFRLEMNRQTQLKKEEYNRWFQERQENNALKAKLEIEEAKNAVHGGEWCAENRKAGRGPCGACAWCCKYSYNQALKEAVQILKENDNYSDVLRGISALEKELK